MNILIFIILSLRFYIYFFKNYLQKNEIIDMIYISYLERWIKLKVVFPCKGVIVLTKEDIQTLNSFYTTSLVTSKIYEIYNSSEYMMQVGNFNYLPQKATLVLDESKLLTIPKMRLILDTHSSQTVSSPETQKQSPAEEHYDEISDDTILSHPFFQTLKPLN